MPKIYGQSYPRPKILLSIKYFDVDKIYGPEGYESYGRFGDNIKKAIGSGEDTKYQKFLMPICLHKGNILHCPAKAPLKLGMELPTVQQRKRLRVSGVNPHLICVLCGGYYIDATTITECLHTFCKTCIVGYLEASKHCPVCDNLVHKTKPHLRLRPDHTLQDLVYKLVPGLFQDEMNKRREFYKDEIQSGKLGENGIEEDRERIIYSQDEQISLVLEMSSNGRPPLSPSAKCSKHNRLEAADRRYLQCPANITVGHLKKFLKMKFDLCDRFQIDFFHTDEILHDHYTLVDIAYIYSWRRKGPLSLYYTVFTNPAKRFKVDHDQDIVIEEVEIPTTEADISKVSERTETSGYLTDDDKDMDDRSMESNVLSESGPNDSFELDTSDLDSSARRDSTDKTVSNENDKNLNSPDSTDKQGKQIEVESETLVDSISNTTKTDKTKPEKENRTEDKENSEVVKEISLDKCDEFQSEIEKNETKELAYKSEDNNKIHFDNSQKEECKFTPEINANNDTQKEKDQNNEKLSSVNQSDKKVFEQKIFNESDVSNKSDAKSEVSNKSDAKIIETKEPKQDINEPVKAKIVKPQTSEASTSTLCGSDSDIRELVTKNDKVSKVKDDEVSEPVVSSTQNTQACQTEPPESHSEKIILPRSSNFEKSENEKMNNREKVDVSCETENFVAMRQISRESVSVSTETEIESSSSDSRKKSVDCSTDVFDFPKSPMENKRTVECSTDSQDFPDLVIDSKPKSLTVDCSTEIVESNLNYKRKALTVDCSTEMDDRASISMKRKSMESHERKALTIDCSTEIDDRASISMKRKSMDSHDQTQGSRKSETKVTKRSNSYSAHSPKTSYKAQPLSPTKITLKFSATKPSPEIVKPEQTPKTQSQVTGFQSKYQSFVMEMPEKTYNFNNEPEKRVQPALPAKTTEGYKQTYMNTISTSAKRSQSKSGRPRGRPPKVKIPEQIDTHKEKKHKSRSHSPKHKKHSDKHSKHSPSLPSSTSKHSSSSSASSSSSNAYSWINKVEHNDKYHGDKKQQKSKVVESASEKPSGELKIPKQFLYFSNGQYTLATESSLATLKASSPRSPTRTVWETQTSSYGDKHSKSEKAKEKEKKSEHKVEKSSVTEKQVSKVESASNDKSPKIPDSVKIPKSIHLPDNVKVPKSMNLPDTVKVPKSINLPDSVNVPKSINITSTVNATKSLKNDKAITKDTNTEIKSDIRNRAGNRTPVSVSSAVSETLSSTVTSTSDSAKDNISSSTEKFPEYRHQSPFFTSFSRLGAHRPSTHLNIPSFTSHFNSAHPLYGPGRYASERLGIPIYRSMSLSEPKNVNVPSVGSKTPEKPRLDALSAPCGFLAPFPSPYLGLSHLQSHIASLPPPLSQKGYSPDSTKPPTSPFSGSPLTGSSSMSQNKTGLKPGTMRKGKEKSIDNIITAITERRTKNETAQEQLNGIDLSTKSSRQNAISLTTNNNDKVDKYAFPDDDDASRVSPKRGAMETK